MIPCKSKSQSSVTTSVKPVSLPYKHGFQINRDNQSHSHIQSTSSTETINQGTRYNMGRY